MPRSVQAYRQNATVTNSPANVSSGDPSDAIDTGNEMFTNIPMLDACVPVTGGTRNPFVAGLNDMGGDTGNSTGVAGQTGNILSGLQMFTDTMCGYALGGVSTGEVIAAWRQIRERNGDPRETYRAMRRLRDAAGAGTTPQSVLSGVEAVTGVINGNPVAQDAISTGQAAAGVSGNQIIDAMNGGQNLANQTHQKLTGKTTTGASGSDLITAGGNAIQQNTAQHVGHQSLTTAQSVALKAENLLVSQDFSSSYTVVGDTHWSWDGTDGAASTNVLGCASVSCDGGQHSLISSEIPVVAGENIEVSCQVKWSGLTYTGASPIILAVEKYRLMKDPAGSGQNVYSDVGWYNVYSVPSPGSSSSGWVGIAGAYEVEAGVDQLRFRLDAAPNATGGTVKWDDAEFLKLDLIADECVPGVGMTTDSIVTQLYGTAGSGFTHNQAATALGSTKAALTSVSSQVAALQAQGRTGAIAGDDFAWSGNITSNANWSGGYTTFSNNPSPAHPNVPGSGTTPDGYYQGSGRKGTAAWIAGDGATQYCYFNWVGTDAISGTDYQLIQVVLASPPSEPYSSAGWLRLYGRIASGWASYVMAAISSSGTYVVDYYSAGARTTIDSGTCAVPGASSTVSFYLGNKASSLPRHYRLEIGTSVVSDVDEVGTGAPLGSSNRGWGWGAEADGNGLYVQGIPPDIDQWLAMDR